VGEALTLRHTYTRRTLAPTLAAPEHVLLSGATVKKAGVAVILSTFGTHKVHLFRQCAGNAVRAGMAHADALAAITSAPAEALRLGKTHGALAAGMVADVVVWSGDPLELSTKVEAMCIGAKPVSLDNRQRALFERYKRPERRAPAPKGEVRRP
jgi:imidazolonepropionase-like amidohydrolase